MEREREEDEVMYQLDFAGGVVFPPEATTSEAESSFDVARLISNTSR